MFLRGKSTSNSLPNFLPDCITTFSMHKLIFVSSSIKTKMIQLTIFLFNLEPWKRILFGSKGKLNPKVKSYQYRHTGNNLRSPLGVRSPSGLRFGWTRFITRNSWHNTSRINYRNAIPSALTNQTLRCLLTTYEHIVV